MNFIKQNRRIIAVLIAFILTVALGMIILSKIAEARSERYTPQEEPSQCDTLSDIKKYACEAVEKEWDIKEWFYFDKIVSQESLNWTIFTAHYKNGYAQVKQPDGTYLTVKSSAHGLGGFLDGTWKTVGCIKTDDPYIQIDCTIKYIKQNYQTPAKALEHHNIKNWY